MWNTIQEVWCKAMHPQAMWPIHGKYICPQCLRQYPVSWEGLPSATEYADPSLRTAEQHDVAPASASMDVCV